jgi:hypothetical protein
VIPAANIPISADEPNWEPLERVLPLHQCSDFMYMGRAREIELYKHYMTRRYLNIARDSQTFYRYSEGKYVEVSQAEALDHVYR